MSVIGDQADGLFIQPYNPAMLDGSVIVREVDAIAFGKLGELNGTFSLSKQIQSLNHHAVQVQQVFLSHVTQGLDEQFAIKNGLVIAHRPLFLHALAYCWRSRFQGSNSLTRLTG